MISISRIIKNDPKSVKIPFETWRFVKISPFFQCAQNTKQLILADLPSWAEQNGTNHFVVACTVVEILIFFVLKLSHWRLDFGNQHNWSLCIHNKAKALKCLTHPSSITCISLGISRVPHFDSSDVAAKWTFSGGPVIRITLKHWKTRKQLYLLETGKKPL